MTAEVTVQSAATEIAVTPKAIEKIRQTFRKMGVEGGLRLGVLGGGCSGLSYQFKFDTKPRAKDKVFDFDGVQILSIPRASFTCTDLLSITRSR